MPKPTWRDRFTLEQEAFDVGRTDAVVHTPGPPQCRAHRPGGRGTCTRPAGHDGDHQEANRKGPFLR